MTDYKAKCAELEVELKDALASRDQAAKIIGEQSERVTELEDFIATMKWAEAYQRFRQEEQQPQKCPEMVPGAEIPYPQARTRQVTYGDKDILAPDEFDNVKETTIQDSEGESNG